MGQVPGTDIGELPLGYAPLPESWVAQALTAADAIERGATSNPSPSAGGGSSPSGLASTGNRASVPAAPVQQASDGTTAEPIVTGEVAGALSGAPTPDDPEIGPLATAVPLGIASGIAAAFATTVLPRLRRRT